MKITRSQLRQIILEEIEYSLDSIESETDPGGEMSGGGKASKLMSYFLGEILGKGLRREKALHRFNNDPDFRRDFLYHMDVRTLERDGSFLGDLEYALQEIIKEPQKIASLTMFLARQGLL